MNDETDTDITELEDAEGHKFRGSSSPAGEDATVGRAAAPGTSRTTPKATPPARATSTTTPKATSFVGRSET